MARPRPDAATQKATLERLDGLSPQKLASPDYDALFGIVALPADEEVLLRAAALIARLYPALAPADADFARRTHTILLHDLRRGRQSLAHASWGELVRTHMREENLAHVPWHGTDEVIAAAECLYGYSEGDLTAEESHRRVRDLVTHAGQHFLRQGRYEEAFRLVSHVPIPAAVMDADYFRLRNVLLLYEQRRVYRVRRSMLVVTLGMCAFIFVLSPVLFMLWEGPYHEQHGHETITFARGLCWSCETATTLGYGDMVPRTRSGRVLAIFDSLLGMVLIGMIAGYILGVVTPRALR